MMKFNKPSKRLYTFKLRIMEYQFLVQHRPGRLNAVADALSRMNDPAENAAKISRIQLAHPMTLMEVFEGANAHRVSALTRQAERQRLEELQLRTNNVDHCNEPRPDNLYVIHENVNTIIDVSDFDRVYYCFSSANCRMRRRLESISGIEINLTNEVVNIDAQRSYVIFPNVCRSTEQMDMAKHVLQIVRHECEKNLFENIAFNIEMPDVPSYFNFKQITAKVFGGTEIIVTFYLNKVITVTDLEDIQRILEAYHRALLGGYAGYARTKNRIRRYYYWPTMGADIKKFVKECNMCAQSKIGRHTRAPMQIRTLATTPFEHLYMDLVGPITPPTTNGFNYIFTCNCELTKFAMATPLTDATAFSTAKAFVQEVVLRFQLPKEVTTHNGTNFTSELFTQVTKLLGIRNILTTPYNPKANLVERFHRSMGQFMRVFVQGHPENWDEFIPFAMHSYNNTPHTTTGYAPQELLFGFAAQIPLNLTRNPTPAYNYDSYVSELRYRLQYSHKIARDNLIKRALENKKHYDKKVHNVEFAVGDVVNLLKQKKDHKFDRPYDGDWKITKIRSPVSVDITKGKTTKRVHFDSLIRANVNED